jgi:hypothetical protein
MIAGGSVNAMRTKVIVVAGVAMALSIVGWKRDQGQKPIPLTSKTCGSTDCGQGGSTNVH